MRIALTVDPEIPVPPVHYGGIERIIDMLARGLVASGHEVTLFAHPRSTTVGRLIPWPGGSSRSIADTTQNTATLARFVLAGEFDLVHASSRLAYLMPILPLSIPKLMTYHRQITRRSIQFGRALSRSTLRFSSVSRWLMRNVADLGKWHLVYNGVPLSNYEFQADPGCNAPLVFLGRVEAYKGAHLAIEIARRTGFPLVIAGNVPIEHHAFFEIHIAPHIDGTKVTYLGPVDDHQKNTLLGDARALLMLTTGSEAFGLVMAEAMACGTPVLAFGHSAAREIVEHGVTGFLADDLEGLVAAAGRLGEIDRAACRARVERLFSDAAVVESYLAVYREMLGGCAMQPSP